MVPGEFKTLPNGISRRGKPNEFLATTSPEYVARDLEMLLELLHDESVPLFQRYFRFMLDLTEIHPFPDGNGKLAALLGDLYLLKQRIHPPFFAKYKWENEPEFYELAEQYSNNPQRDISIFYSVAVRAYKRLILATQWIRSSGNHVEWLRFQHVIKTALFPRPLTKLKNDNQTDHVLVKSFAQHTVVLAKFCADYFKDHDDLSIRFICDLHKMLYPPGVFIRSVRYGVPVDTLPGGWRTQVLLLDDYWVPSISRPSDIEMDFERLMERFCDSSKVMSRERIFAFYVDFISVHPFADSNGTLAALLCDVECFRHGFRPLGIRYLHAMDVQLLYQLTRQCACERTEATLRQSLMAIDNTLLHSGFSPPSVLLEDLTKDEAIANLLHQVSAWHLESTVIHSRNIFVDLPSGLPPEARPYWNSRYTVFPRWDDGIQTDWQGLYSVKPQVFAMQLAASLPGKVVLDAFCGIGGCAIAFALSDKKVLAVEIDEHRLGMARNNARVYGVEDRITFIHGDVTKLVGTLHYDAAFFDPPWGGLENRQNATFCWDDFPVNPIPLIHAALARCNIVGLAVPANFNVAELHMDEYELAVQKAEMAQQLWWLNAFYRKPSTALCLTK